MRKKVYRQIKKLKNKGIVFSHLNKSVPKRKVFSSKKRCLQEEFVVARSFFPDLDDVVIHFRKRRQFFVMSSYVWMPSFFRKKRSYVIYYSDRLEDALFDDFSYRGRIGILCHELAHVQEYEELSFWGLLWWSIRYVFPHSRQSIEFQTDLRACAAGATKYVVEYVRCFFKSELIPFAKKRYRNRCYLRLNELRWLEHRGSV